MTCISPRTTTCVFLLAGLLMPGIAFGADMTTGEIRDELVGRSIYWWEADGWLRGQLVLAPDGFAEITVEKPDVKGDTGTWALKNDQICTAWAGFRSGDEKCYSLTREAPGRFVTSGGNIFEIRETGV
jgi:hypothetical protein